MAKIRKIYSSVWEKWAKKGIFGQKRPKNQKLEFSSGIFFHHFLKDQKNRFLWEKSGKFIVAFGRYGPKRAFLAKNGQKIENKNFHA